MQSPRNTARADKCHMQRQGLSRLRDQMDMQNVCRDARATFLFHVPACSVLCCLSDAYPYRSVLSTHAQESGKGMVGNDSRMDAHAGLLALGRHAVALLSADTRLESMFRNGICRDLVTMRMRGSMSAGRCNPW